MASENGGASDEKTIGEDAVGRRVGVFWDGEERYFFGKVVTYRPQRRKKQYRVRYDDGDTQWEYGDALDFKAAENKANGKTSAKPLQRKRPRTPPPERLVKKAANKGKNTDEDEDEDDSEKEVEFGNNTTSPSQNDVKVETGSSASKLKSSADFDMTTSNTKAAHSVSVGHENVLVGPSLTRKESADSSSLPPPPPPPPENENIASVKEENVAHLSESKLKSTAKAQHSINHLLGLRCKVFWSGEDEYFHGSIVKTNSGKGMVLVSYDDGDREWEVIDDVVMVPSGYQSDSTPPRSSESKTKTSPSSNLEDSPGRKKKTKRRRSSVSTTDGHLVKEETESERSSKAGVKSKQSLETMKSAGEGNNPADRAQQSPERALGTPEVRSASLYQPAEWRGSQAVGLKVEYVSLSEKLKGVADEKQTAEIISCDETTQTYVVALSAKNLGVLETEVLDGKRRFVVTYLEKAKTPLILDRIFRGDALSVGKLLSTGSAAALPLTTAGTERDENIFQQVLKRTPPNAKSELLKMLLDQAPTVLCDLETCLLLVHRCVESFKDHILLRFVINRIKMAAKMMTSKSEKDLELLDDIYRYCVDHILRLNAQEKLDKVDQLLMAILYEESIGFTLDRKVRQLPSPALLKQPEGRGNSVLEGTPLVLAMARGNVSMVVHLMETEKQRSGQVSKAHWSAFSLQDQYSSYMDEWGLVGSPVRLALFFFIVAKSFGGPKSLTKVILALVRLCDFELNPISTSKNSRAPLLFLCGQTEKRFQIRIREAMLQLMAAGAKANLVDESGTTPLLACVQHKSPRFIELLLQNGDADPNLGQPLIRACELDRHDEIEALISGGAALTIDLIADNRGIWSNLFSEKEDLFEKMLNQIQDPGRRQEILDQLLLDVCCTNADSTLAATLLHHGATIAAQDESGNNPVMACVLRGHSSLLLQVIRGLGLDVNTLKVPTSDQLLVVWACGVGSHVVVKALLEASQSSAQTFGKESAGKKSFKGQGSTQLHRKRLPANPVSEPSSKKPSHFPVPQELSRHSKRMTGAGLRGFSNQNVLVAACESGNDELVELLLSSGSPLVEVNCKAIESGWTPLHLASGLGKPKIVSLLLDHGANASDVDAQGQTALAWAAVAGECNVARILVTKGGSDLSIRDSSGLTPLDLAIRHGNSDVATELVQLGATLDNVLHHF